MGMRAPVTGNSDMQREVPPPGKYLGACNGVYMLGTQPGYQGGPPRMQLMLSFELHKRRGPAKDANGRVYETSAIMTFTANIKSKLIEYASALEGRSYMEEDLEAIARGGGFDPEALMDKVCWIDLVHEKKVDGGIRDRIKTVTPLDAEDDAELGEHVEENRETNSIYWDWTKGEECPKRIRYFWDRAAENPDRKPIPALSGLGSDAARPGDEEIPF